MQDSEYFLDHELWLQLLLEGVLQEKKKKEKEDSSGMCIEMQTTQWDNTSHPLRWL